jgi:hypothetical protein
VNGQFHIQAVLVPVTDCDLVGPQRQVGSSEEINRLPLPTFEPRFLCVKFPRRQMYRFVNMLMISSWIEGIFRKNVEKKLTFFMEYIFQGIVQFTRNAAEPARFSK